jgi:hypothetical protein
MARREVPVYVKVLPQNVPEGTEYTHDKPKT